ncbi:hypothetical protein [Streptomyces parvulus]|uniref:hypothetical protein n=1 Tax=Streptomyces parvulus TaxID=146923 RepID=UPI0033FC576F
MTEQTTRHTSHGMRTQLVTTAADVISRAMQQGRTLPAALAVALDSAQMLQSPETVKQLAEYERLNPQQCPAGQHADWLIDSQYAHACPWCRIAELQAERHTTNEALSDAAEQLRANRDRIAELENLAGQATEFRVWEPGYGLYVRRAPGATGYAVMEARRTDKGRRVWTTAGWQYAVTLTDTELFCWPDAQTAVTEAHRIMPGATVTAEHDAEADQ